MMTTSLQEIGLAALIFNDRWHEVRQELQWNPEIFMTFRLRQAGESSSSNNNNNNNNNQEITVLHLLSSKGEKCPIDLLESILNIGPDLVKINSEPLLQSLLEHRMWEIVCLILQLYPDIIQSCLFATRHQEHVMTTLHVLCLRRDRDVVCPPMNLINGVLDAAPEWLQWSCPGIPLHYAIHACCIEPYMSFEQLKWLDLVQTLLERYPEGVAVASSEPILSTTHHTNSGGTGCTPLVLAVALGASPHVIQRLMQAGTDALLLQAGVHASYQKLANDPTPYNGRDDDRKAVLALLRRFNYPSLLSNSIVRWNRGSEWLAERWENHRWRRHQQLQQQQQQAVSTNSRPTMLLPQLIAITAPTGLSLSFHNNDNESRTTSGDNDNRNNRQTSQGASRANDDDEEEDEEDDACIVCWDGQADHVVIPCGHVCLCNSCSGRLQSNASSSSSSSSNRSKCPVCNGNVQQTLKIFGAGVSRNSATTRTRTRRRRRSRRATS